MTTIIFFAVMFIAKVVDNTLSASKTILIQRNHSILAGITVAASDFIYFMLIKNVLSDESPAAIIIVSVAGGIGCWIAVFLSDRLSREVMSDDKPTMQAFRDYLAEHHVTNVAADSYTRDWNTKTITVTAYADTKDKNRLIDDYFENSELKFKRVIHKI